MFIDDSAENITVGPKPVFTDARAAMAALDEYPTAVIGDAMGRMNFMRHEIRRLWKSPRIGGKALTVTTRDGDNLAIHRAIDEADAGDILVIDGLGGTSRALFGGVLAAIALGAGIAGVVIDGLARDIDELAELGLPVWGLGLSPAGPSKDGPGTVNLPISCGGVVVSPSDYIAADGDGVVVVPASEVSATLEKAQAVLEREDRVRALIRKNSLRLL